MLILSNQSFRQHYHTLTKGDRVCCRLSLRPTEESLLLDLAARGVCLFPSALAQCLSHSKTLQASVLKPWMLPASSPVHDLHQLMDYMHRHAELALEKIITKADRKNAGLGVHVWSGLEEVFNQASLEVLPFPFVIQPFVPDCYDIRVIMLGDYIEAYRRENAKNFRNNLHFGGQSTPVELTPGQMQLCREVTDRGQFPYAHIDLLVDPHGQSSLTEINLRGGIRGARIRADEYQQRLKEIHQGFIDGQA